MTNRTESAVPRINREKRQEQAMIDRLKSEESKVIKIPPPKNVVLTVPETD